MPNPCQQAAHITLSERTRKLAPNPDQMTRAQAESILIECRFNARHRGPHRPAKPQVVASWTGKLDSDEMAYAGAIRARLRELTA